MTFSIRYAASRRQARQLRPATASVLAAALAAIMAAPVHAAPDAAPKADPAARVQVVLSPKPDTTFLHTSSTKSKTTVKLLKGSDKTQTVADVMTNIIEIDTGEKDFAGTLPFSVKLVDSKAQAMTQKLQPLPRTSPLAPLIDSKIELNLYHDGTIKIADIRMPGKVDLEGVQTMHKMAETMLFPFQPPRLQLAEGESFQLSEIRQFPVEGENVPFEMLRKFTLLEIAPAYLLLKSETVVRPRRKDQAQQIFGKGEGKVVVNRDTGVVEQSTDNVVMDAKVLGRKGWVVFRTETETETLTTPR